MRISGGRLRGREVPMPRHGEVRPTGAKVREALYSVLGQELAGWTVLDAFAGAGLLGLEAASRGADDVLLVDRDPRVVAHLGAVIRGLAGALESGARVRVRRDDAARVLAEASRWDLVLLDPPYAEDPLRWLRLGAGRARRVLVLEHRWGAAPPATVEELALDRHRRYGDTGLAVYRRVGGDAGEAPEQAPGAS